MLKKLIDQENHTFYENLTITTYPTFQINTADFRFRKLTIQPVLGKSVNINFVKVMSTQNPMHNFWL